MLLRYAILCDFANVTQEGKLNILGVFDRLFAVNFPAIHRELFLVTCIETEPEDEGGQHEMQVQLINQDANVLADLRGQINLGPGKQIINQLHVFQDLRFETPGAYQFNIFLNNRNVKTIDLELQHVPQQM
jgi:hypothetical protein